MGYASLSTGNILFLSMNKVKTVDTRKFGVGKGCDNEHDLVIGVQISNFRGKDQKKYLSATLVSDVSANVSLCVLLFLS